MILLVSNLLAGFGFSAPFASHFEVRGYEEKTKRANYSLSIKASAAEGLGQMTSKTLYNAQIEITNSDRQISIRGSQTYFDKTQILITGSGEFSYADKTIKKGLLTVNSMGPENTIYYQIDDNRVTAPAARMKLHGKIFQGRGLVLDLHKRLIIWVQSVVSPGGSALKTPYELKF